MALNIIILAAGQGTRMNSTKPKVLHTIGGISLLERVINTAQSLNPEKIFIVYGHGGTEIKRQLSQHAVTWVEQKQQLGTGHAVMQVLPELNNTHDQLLILYGDVPLISKETLQELLNQTTSDALGLLTVNLDKPFGFGRIIRGTQNKVMAIVEEKDTNDDQKLIREVNTGIMTTSVNNLKQWLPKLSTHNAKNEYYLTDVVKLAATEKTFILGLQANDVEETQGINDKIQLAQAERYFQKQMANKLMLSGVTLLDPSRLDIRGNIEVSADVTIDINVILEGRVIIGKNSYIGANCILRDVMIGESVEIKPNTIIDGATIGNNCTIGPFARIRPETFLADNAKIGNFVEIKKSDIGANSKVPHHSYIGDTTMGQFVNVGAGTITCNYDGANKHHTTIGNNVFIGSDTQFIAPVTIEDDATIGAGSTITKNVPGGQLTLSRNSQKTINGWKRPEKKKDN